MSNAERLAAALEGVFPAGVETGVDASTIDRMIESLAPLVSPNFAGGSMTARGGVAQRYDDAVGLQSAWVDWVGGFESVSRRARASNRLARTRSSSPARSAPRATGWRSSSPARPCSSSATGRSRGSSSTSTARRARLGARARLAAFDQSVGDNSRSEVASAHHAVQYRHLTARRPGVDANRGRDRLRRRRPVDGRADDLSAGEAEVGPAGLVLGRRDRERLATG